MRGIVPRMGRVLLALALALGLAAALGAPATDAQSRSRTLVIAIPTEPPHLDPYDSVGIQADLIYHITRKLYAFTPDMAIRPDLAVSEKISPDQRTWTFELRKDAVLHDGTPVNAQAVKYSIDRMKDPKRAAPLGILFAAVKEVRVAGEYTVVIETAEPFAPLRANLAHPNAGVVSAAADRALGAQFGRKPVSAGPYYVADWISGDRIILKRFEKYAGRKPYYETLIFRIVPDPQTRLIMLERGEADVAIRMPATHAPHVARISKLQVIRLESTRLLYFWLNLDKAPTSDVRVRRALNMAVDRDTVTKRVALGAGSPVQTLFAEGLVAFATPVGKFEYKPEEARALLREAGALGQPVRMVAPQGNYEFDRPIAEAVAGYLRAAGLRAELEIMEDVGAYLATVRRREHHMGMLGFGAATGDPDHYLRRQLWGEIAGKPWNFSGYKNPRVDEMIRVGARTMDVRERAKVYVEMQRILWNDYPWLALHRVASFAFARAGIQGIEVYLASQAHVYTNARPKEN